jgi:hypothetical protein
MEPKVLLLKPGIKSSLSDLSKETVQTLLKTGDAILVSVERLNEFCCSLETFKVASEDATKKAIELNKTIKEFKKLPPKDRGSSYINKPKFNFKRR